MSLQRFAKLPTENVDFIGWLTQKTRFFEIELSNLGSLTRDCAQSDLQVMPVRGNLFRRPAVCGRWAHVYDDVQVVAHDRPRVHATGKNVFQLQNTVFNPRFSVLETFVEAFIQAAQPRSAHAAVDAVKRSRLRGSISWLRGWVMGAVCACGLSVKIGLGAILNRIYLSAGCPHNFPTRSCISTIRTGIGISWQCDIQKVRNIYQKPILI